MRRTIPLLLVASLILTPIMVQAHDTRSVSYILNSVYTGAGSSWASEWGQMDFDVTGTPDKDLVVVSGSSPRTIQAITFDGTTWSHVSLFQDATVWKFARGANLDKANGTDLMYLAVGGNNVYQAIEDGAGGYTASLIFTSGKVVSLDVGDLNGDGADDVVVGEEDRLTVLLNDGTATTWTPITLDSDTIVNFYYTSPPTDLDNDGDMDLLVGEDERKTAHVWLGDGSGTTWSEQTIAGATGDAWWASQHFQIKDTDGDNFPEAMVSMNHGGSGQDFWTIKTTDGLSWTATVFQTGIAQAGANARWVWDDLDGNGDHDLHTAPGTFPTQSATVLNVNGTLTKYTCSSGCFGSATPINLVRMDFGDGNHTYAITSSGVFQVTYTFPEDPGPLHHVTLSGITTNSVVDLDTPLSITLEFHDVAGNLFPVSAFTVIPKTYPGIPLASSVEIEAADASNGSATFLVSFHAPGNFRIYVEVDGIEYDTTAHFWVKASLVGHEGTPVATEAAPLGFWAQDLNGDTHTDFLHFGSGAIVTSYLGDGTGGFAKASQLTIPVPVTVSDHTWAPLVDLDNDGDLDALFSVGDYLTILTNAGNGSFSITWNTTDTNYTADKYHIVRALDYMGDNVPELVAIHASGNVSAWQRQGDGSYLDLGTVATTHPTSVNYAVSRPIDVNDDGFLDITFGGSTPFDLYALYSHGNGTFTSAGFGFGGLKTAQEFYRLDLANDGISDYVFSSNGVYTYAPVTEGGMGPIQSFDGQPAKDYGYTLTPGIYLQPGFLDDNVAMAMLGYGGFKEIAAGVTTTALFYRDVIDYDEDGDVDLIGATSTGQIVLVENTATYPLPSLEPEPDADMDGIPDATDNCPTDANADQADADMDGIGDACEAAPSNDVDGASGPVDVQSSRFTATGFVIWVSVVGAMVVSTLGAMVYRYQLRPAWVALIALALLILASAATTLWWPKIAAIMGWAS